MSGRQFGKAAQNTLVGGEICGSYRTLVGFFRDAE
jgi:hypothetical protein